MRASREADECGQASGSQNESKRRHGRANIDSKCTLVPTGALSAHMPLTLLTHMSDTCAHCCQERTRLQRCGKTNLETEKWAGLAWATCRSFNEIRSVLSRIPSDMCDRTWCCNWSWSRPCPEAVAPSSETPKPGMSSTMNKSAKSQHWLPSSFQRQEALRRNHHLLLVAHDESHRHNLRVLHLDVPNHLEILGGQGRLQHRSDGCLCGLEGEAGLQGGDLEGHCARRVEGCMLCDAGCTAVCQELVQSLGGQKVTAVSRSLYFGDVPGRPSEYDTLKNGRRLARRPH